MVRIAVGIISFNSMPFLHGAIRCIYPHAEQIFVADGPVQYWQDMGHRQSTDGTLALLYSEGLDPDDKITIIKGQWPEKDEQHRAYAYLIREDITHLWIIDPDELYRQDDILAVKDILGEYDLVAFRPIHFVDSFDICIHDTTARQRILRWEPGIKLLTSRPPTTSRIGMTHRVLSGRTLAKSGIYMYHYSHVFRHQVKNRAEYYRAHPSGVAIPSGQRELFHGHHPTWITQNRERLERTYG